MRKNEILERVFVVGLLISSILLSSVPLVQANSSSSVCTTTNWLAITHGFQRQSFYDNGRFWVFYSDSDYNMAYCTSVDGNTWTAPTTVRYCMDSDDFSIFFDGTYLHYVYADWSAISYRRGIPNENGTITWSQIEQTVSSSYNQVVFPYMAVDSSGYVWIGYRERTGSTGQPSYPFVIRSGNNDGTWGTTPENFPYQLAATDGAWATSVVSLTAGKMLTFYAYVDATVKAKSWDGSAWGTEVVTTSEIKTGRFHSSTAQGDNAHLVFLGKDGYSVFYTKYIYETNSFTSETTLRVGTASNSTPIISRNPSKNDLYVFWAGFPTAHHIYYRKYNASLDTWETAIDWIDESSESIPANEYITSFYQAHNNYIGLVYLTKASSPYNVKFAFLDFTPKWNLIETWTGMINVPAEWSLVETWTGMINVPAEWSLVETWTGMINVPAEWSLVETWTGNVSVPSAPTPPTPPPYSGVYPPSGKGRLTMDITVELLFTGTLSPSSPFSAQVRLFNTSSYWNEVYVSISVDNVISQSKLIRISSHSQTESVFKGVSPSQSGEYSLVVEVSYAETREPIDSVQTSFSVASPFPWEVVAVVVVVAVCVLVAVVSRRGNLIDDAKRLRGS